MKRFKKWFLVSLVTVFLMLAVIMGMVIYIDPFFQYHAPLEKFPYLVDNQLPRCGGNHAGALSGSGNLGWPCHSQYRHPGIDWWLCRRAGAACSG